MPVFLYEAVDAKGKRIRDEVEAKHREEAKDKIQKLGFRLRVIREKPGGAAAPAPAAAGARIPRGRVSSQKLCEFTTRLSTLQDAGLPIVRSLKILANQEKHRTFRAVVEAVANEVEGGLPLSDALGKHPKVFEKLYVNMIKAGEASGSLEVILNRLSTFIEKSQRLKRRLIGAMIYPAVVIGVAGLILLAIMMFVVPSFQKIFADLGQQLPLLTSILIRTSGVIKAWWFVFPVVPLGAWIVFTVAVRSSGGRLMWDRIVLKFPVFGTIIRKSVISRFSRTLGTLIASGVPILEALAIVRNVMGNQVMADAIGIVYDSIRSGDTIAEPLAQCKLFDDVVVNMIDVGEETGELDKMLIKIADNHDDEVDQAVGNMVSLLEPIMIVSLGGIIGFIVIALFLPLISLIQNLG